MARCGSARRELRHATSAITARPIADAEGFVDTGDMVELRGDRYYFVGRRDGVINIGGLKVHPEEVEAVINRHPEVQDVAGPDQEESDHGALVVADVVLKMRQSPQERCERTATRYPAALPRSACLGIRFRRRSTSSAACRSLRPGKIVRQPCVM